MAAGLELVNRLEGVELPPAAERARLWLLTVIDAGEDLFPRCQGRTTVQRETLPGPDGGAQELVPLALRVWRPRLPA